MVRARATHTIGLWCLVSSAILGVPAASVWATEPIKVGLVAALSGQSAKSGEGITRGLTIAIDEINARGGLLGGRQLTLTRRDDESNPSKGQIAARELIFKEKVADVIFLVATVAPGALHDVIHGRTADLACSGLSNVPHAHARGPCQRFNP